MRVPSLSHTPIKGAVALFVAVVLVAIGFLAGKSGTSQTDIGLIGTATRNTEQGPSKAAMDAMYPYWGGGNTVLEPDDSISNTTGVASGYGFDPSAVDGKDLMGRLSKVLGVSGAATFNINGSLAFLESDGNYLSISVDSLASFSGFNNARSPWRCGQVVKGDPGVQADGTGQANSSSPGLPSPAPAPDVCPTTEKTTEINKAEAIAIVKKALTTLGEKPVDMIISATQYDPSEVGVSATPIFMGRALPTAWSFSVSSAGIYSLNGFFAKVKELGQYEIAGARDVALRSQLTRWTSLAPVMIRSAQATEDASNSPVSTSTAAPDTQPTKLPAKLVNGLPALTAYTNKVKVVSAKSTLVQQYASNGDVLLLPGWEYLDDKGNLWAAVSIAEKYVDFTNTYSYGGPMPMVASKATR